MNDQICQKPSDGLEVFRKLADQFSQNFVTALGVATPEISRVELKSRCLSTVGEILRDKCAASESQKLIAGIYDEIFADCIYSIYLAAQGLDKPAQLVLRRVLELGLAAVYLWDQPHLFWGWKELDQDLSFNEITGHLSGQPYLRFVASENSSTETILLFDLNLARNEYRALKDSADHCPSCSAALAPDAKFCSGCGTRLESKPIITGLLEEPINALSISDRLKDRVRPKFARVGDVVQARKEEIMTIPYIKDVRSRMIKNAADEFISG